MRLILLTVITLCTTLAACTRSADDMLVGRTKELLEGHLRGQAIELVGLKSGERLTLPDVVSVDGSADGRCLSVAFSRGDFNDDFIRELFYAKDKTRLGQLSPFTEPGVEAILTVDRVVLNLYSGVVIHLRSDLSYPGGITPFKSKQIEGNVVKIVGNAVHAKPDALPDVLRTFLYLRDGRAVAFGSTERDKQKGGEQSDQAAEATAKMSLSFTPTVMNRAVDPSAVACTVKPFRN